MERLKAILADKILDLSSVHSDDVKAKIDRMQRFRDFANACQTLMTKYPQIEDELIKMVNDGDFDTKVASSRVDSVIRLADKEKNQEQVNEVEKLITQESEIANLPVSEEIADEPVFYPEDIDYEEIDNTEDDSKNGYVPYEDVKTQSSDNYSTELSDTEKEELEAKKKRKETIRRVVQIIGIIIAVIVLIIIIKFVIKHWVVILSIIGGIALIALIIWFIKKKKS